MFDDRNVFPYQMSAGVDYWDHGTYCLSSQVGFLKKGGKALVTDWSEYYPDYGHEIPLRLHARYITLNTTFNLKTQPAHGFYWVFGVGPRIDINLNNSLYWDETPPNGMATALPDLYPVLWGLKCFMGVRKEIGKLQIGLHAAYLPTFSRIGKVYDGFSGGRDRTFTLGLSFGYIVHKDKGKHYSIRRLRKAEMME